MNYHSLTPKETKAMRDEFAKDRKFVKDRDGTLHVYADRVEIANLLGTPEKGILLMVVWIGNVSVMLPINRGALKRLKREFDLREATNARLRTNVSLQHAESLYKLSPGTHGV